MLWLFRVWDYAWVLRALLLELSRWKIRFIREFNPVKSHQDGQWMWSIVNALCQTPPLSSVLRLPPASLLGTQPSIQTRASWPTSTCEMLVPWYITYTSLCSMSVCFLLGKNESLALLFMSILILELVICCLTSLHHKTEPVLLFSVHWWPSVIAWTPAAAKFSKDSITFKIPRCDSYLPNGTKPIISFLYSYKIMHSPL